jgi:hypothetical protein
MRTQPEIESEIEYFKAFARATATALEDIRKRLTRIEKGDRYGPNL